MHSLCILIHTVKESGGISHAQSLAERKISKLMT